MKQYFGNYLGLVINNSDPEYRGRVQVFIPHIMPALYEGWNKEGKDIQISCVGSNIPEGLDPGIHEKLVQILPWAEAASPIIGSSAPGNLFSNMVAGAKSGATTGGILGAVAGAAAAATNHFYNQSPTSAPVQVEGGDAQALINKAKGIAKLDYDPNVTLDSTHKPGQQWGMCARGTTGLDKAAGLIDDNGPSAGFNAASDLAAGGSLFNTAKAGNYVNPYVTGTGAKYFQPGFTIPPNIQTNKQTGKKNLIGAQVGDSVFAGGGGKGHGHAQKLVGIDKNGDQVWVSDNPQATGFFDNYNNFTVYRLNDEGLAKYTAAIGGKVTGQEPPSSTTAENTADAGLAGPNPLTNAQGEQNPVAPPETTMALGGSGTGTPAGTISGGGTATTTTGNTQVRNFSGSNSQAYATARAAALAAGSPDPDVTASVAMFESGHLGSSMSKRANNPFGQTITQAQIGTNGIVGGTRGRDGQLHAVYDSLESAMAHHVKKWGSRYEAGNPGQTLNNMVAGNYNIESINGLPPGQYWKDGVLGRYNKLSGQTAAPVEGLAGEPPSESTANLVNPNGISVVNNTDNGGRTPIVNTNDMASGLFAYPNPGAMVWVFFREGNPLFPVYFAASYSSAEWKSAYRHGSEGELMTFDDPNVRVEASVLKPSSAFSLLSKKRINLANPLDNESAFSLAHEHGSNITMKDGYDYFYSRNNKRDEVDNDRFVITKGYKEEWTQGDASTNTKGNLIVKVGNITQEAIDAMNELADMSYEMNQKLMEKPK